MKDPVLPTLRKLRAGPGTGPRALRAVTDHPILVHVARVGLIASGVMHF